MDSLRDFAQCIGVTGNFSVARNFFGFARGFVPPDPTGATTVVSIKDQIELLKGEHFHVNIIKVGSDLFDDADDREIDYAVYKIRNVYDNVSIGVGRVLHIGILQTDSQGFWNVTTDDQVTDVTNTWYVPNDGIDVFIPFSFSVSTNGGNLLGRSPVPGPCEDKDDKGMNGAVTGVWNSDDQTARTFAHEIGHYLGLGHRNGTPMNLMAQSGVANNPPTSTIRTAVQLTAGQGNTADDHCLCDDDC